jgi:hypothetical protein
VGWWVGLCPTNPPTTNRSQRSTASKNISSAGLWVGWALPHPPTTNSNEVKSNNSNNTSKAGRRVEQARDAPEARGKVSKGVQRGANEMFEDYQ